MNQKTYSYVKYIATFGSILLFLAPLLGFLQEWSFLQPSHFNNGFVFHTQVALAVTTWVLEVVGIILICVYAYIRMRLKAKSEYVYTKKDETKLSLAFGMYLGLILFSFIYVIISCGIFGGPHTSGLMGHGHYLKDGTSVDSNEFKVLWNQDGSIAKSRVVGIMITFAPFYVAEFAFSILGAIFESMSRIQEQIFLNQQTDDLKKKNKDAVSKSGIKRTKEAQSLFDEDDKTSKKKSTTTKKKPKAEKHKSEEYIDDAQELEDFFNEDDDKKDN